MRFNHSNKHIRDAIRYAESKTGGLRRRAPELISGVDSGIRAAHAMAAAHKSCQHQETPSCMPEISAATLTDALIL